MNALHNQQSTCRQLSILHQTYAPQRSARRLHDHFSRLDERPDEPPELQPLAGPARQAVFAVRKRLDQRDLDLRGKAHAEDEPGRGSRGRGQIRKGSSLFTLYLTLPSGEVRGHTHHQGGLKAPPLLLVSYHLQHLPSHHSSRHNTHGWISCTMSVNAMPLLTCISRIPESVWTVDKSVWIRARVRIYKGVYRHWCRHECKCMEVGIVGKRFVMSCASELDSMGPTHSQMPR